MTLSQTQRGARVVVASVSCEPSMADRLRALGVYPRAALIVLKISPRKKVWFVRTESARIALGAELAACIGVQ